MAKKSSVLYLCGFIAITWGISIILGVVIYTSLSNYGALIDNECYKGEGVFTQANYHIPNVIDRKNGITLYSINSNLTKRYYLSKYRTESLIAGMLGPFVGGLSYQAYPRDNYCLDQESKYKIMTIVLLIFWIAIIGSFAIFILCVANIDWFGIWAICILCGD